MERFVQEEEDVQGNLLHDGNWAGLKLGQVRWVRLVSLFLLFILLFLFPFSFEYFSGNLRREGLKFENWNLNPERLKPYIPTMVGLREIKE
jgi:hypothetical protein